MRRLRSPAILAFLLGLNSPLAGCQAGTPTAGDRLPFPAADRPVAPIVSSAYSTEEERDGHGEAERVMERLGIMAGMRVADIGAGDGYYTVRLARRLGAGALLYAQDVRPEFLKGLAGRLQRQRTDSVQLILGSPRDPRLPPGSIDVAILSRMYHEIENPYEFLYRLWPALRPGGRVAIIDNDRLTQDHGTPPALLRCELGAVGYRQVDFLLLAPAEGYLAVFAPPQKLPPPESIAPCKQ